MTAGPLEIGEGACKTALADDRASILNTRVAVVDNGVMGTGTVIQRLVERVQCKVSHGEKVVMLGLAQRALVDLAVGVAR